MSSLLEAFPVALSHPYAMLKSILTHTRTSFETPGHRAIWDSYLPVLVPAFIWLFVEGAIWISKKK